MRCSEIFMLVVWGRGVGWGDNGFLYWYVSCNDWVRLK